MNIEKRYKNLKLLINEDLLQQLVNKSHEHYPNEYGGLLIGKYSNDNKEICITNSILPSIFSSSQISFERCTQNLTETIKNIYKQTKSYYVGEWHTHPNASVQYSPTDLSAMQSIVNTDEVAITNPILLILSTSNNALLDYQFYFFDNGRLEPYD